MTGLGTVVGDWSNEHRTGTCTIDPKKITEYVDFGQYFCLGTWPKDLGRILLFWKGFLLNCHGPLAGGESLAT